jgi:hypothetical protein
MWTRKMILIEIHCNAVKFFQFIYAIYLLLRTAMLSSLFDLFMKFIFYLLSLQRPQGRNMSGK